MVLYLKYRPQTLSEVLGQENIIQTLKMAKAQDRLSHAYLFCGPRGVGKTSTARILAKIVNCPANGEDNCDICQSIADGSNMDLIEIDAASNRGIDDIRDLREKIKLAPSSLKKKVYIIDEVHMLTSEAFNALLKTLEEPPAHVLFILATTDPQKIPATILSRVTRLDFSGGTKDSLKLALERVVKGEKIDIEDEALDLIIKKSDGSFRDGIKLLDQFASSNAKITAAIIEEGLRSSKFEDALNLIDALSRKDIPGALNLVNESSSQGINLKEYLYSTTEILRALLLIRHQADALVKKSFTGEKYQALVDLSSKFQPEELVQIINSLLGAVEQLKFSLVATLPLEVAIIESCSGAKPKTIEAVVVEVLPASPVTEKILDIPIKPDPNPAPGNPSNDLITLKDKWNYILEVIRPYNFSLEAMLRSVKLDSVEGNVVMLKVPYAFHQRILETPRNRDFLESVFADVLDKTVKVGCILDTRPVRIEELANVEVAADDEVIRLAAEIFNSDQVN